MTSQIAATTTTRTAACPSGASNMNRMSAVSSGMYSTGTSRYGVPGAAATWMNRATSSAIAAAGCRTNTASHTIAWPDNSSALIGSIDDRREPVAVRPRRDCSPGVPVPREMQP